MSRWRTFLDQQVARQRARRDPLSRLPWWSSLLLGLFLVVLGVVQVALGSGASKVLGLALLLLVAPSQLVAAYATRQVQKDRPVS